MSMMDANMIVITLISIISILALVVNTNNAFCDAMTRVK